MQLIRLSVKIKERGYDLKKNIYFYLYLLFLIVILSGCSVKEEENVSLEIWHYYNGAQKIAFDKYVLDFNESQGLEKGIIVEAFSQGNISQLEEKIIESIDKKVGASQIPNIVAIYPEIAYTLDQKGKIVNLENYITNEEIYEYVDSYIEEGRLGKENKFKIFPTAKATEIMMVNKTDWDIFSKATGAQTEDLISWEGLKSTSELYYNWTDSLTEEKNDGKAFFGRDALANYMLVGSKQLGKDIFQVEGDTVLVDLDPYIMRRLWDNYYIPYISGYYTSHGRFSTDDAKTGDIIALVGSTTGATYFPDNVTIENNDSYDIDLLVLPLPNFENTGLNAVQQGAGMAVISSDKSHEKASVEFLKWFTQESINSQFSIRSGYLPVKKSAYDIEGFNMEFTGDNTQGISKKIQKTIPQAMEQVKKYDLHISKPFKEASQARIILERTLEDKSKEDRGKFVKLLDQGISHKEAIEKFSTDKNFDQWFLEFKDSIMGIVKNEE